MGKGLTFDADVIVRWQDDDPHDVYAIHPATASQGVWQFPKEFGEKVRLRDELRNTLLKHRRVTLYLI